MAPSGSFGRLALVLLLLAEVWLFTGSIDKFFNHDSLFYLIHSPRSFEDLGGLLVAPDSAKQYRPLSLAFMGLFVPFLSLDPGPYHWIPVVFHMLNTLLFYRLASRVLSESLSVLAATAFWGLHSVAVWITYDTTCISDLLLASFFLLSLILAVDGVKKTSRLRLCGSFLFFICALLSKEVAVLFPLALVLTLIMAEVKEDGGRASLAAIPRSLKKCVPFVSLVLILSLAHAALLTHWLRSGALYTQGGAAAYDINPLANLVAKLKYVYWALNLPDPLQIPRANAARLIALCSIGFLILLWCVDVFLRKGRLLTTEWAGWLWLVGLNIPAFMLSSRLAKWYLYVPLIGLALALGSLAGRVRRRLSFLPQRAADAGVLGLFLAPFLFSSFAQGRSYLVSSDAVYASDTLETCLRGLQEENADFPPRVSLFLLPLADFERNVAGLLTAPPISDGELFELFYAGTEVRLLSADKGDRLPEGYRSREDLRVIQYLLGHLNDVSDYYKGRRRSSSATRLIRTLDGVRATVSREEFYPAYDSFQTPGGTPVFFSTQDREIFTQIGGSTAAVAIGEILPGAILRFDTAWMFSAGDGAWAELCVRSGGKEESLYREYLKPVPPRGALRWKEVVADLTPYAGQEAELVLKCYNDPGKTTIADWLSWREMVIEYPKAGAEGGLVSPKTNANGRKTERKAPPTS